MKILIVNNSDNVGGAARAAYRLHKLFLKKNIFSRMLVRIKRTDDYTVQKLSGVMTIFSKIRYPLINLLLKKMHKSNNKNMHSINILPSNLSKTINSSDADIVNLHWIGGETLSLKDVSRINKKVVWTMHDMWPFCGAEHYTERDDRWVKGYNKKNNIETMSCLDISKYVWDKKRRIYKDICFVSPSKWLAECASKSYLLRDMRIEVIPNAIDFAIYKPLSKKYARTVFDFNLSKTIILFGAIGGGQDPRKGYDLLIGALKQLSEITESPESITCVFFGQEEPEIKPDICFESIWLGHLNDNYSMSLLYNAADVVVIPSRQENLPQIATEAQSCGCPVVGFNCTGVADAVEHMTTGYLATPFNIVDMAEGINLIIKNKDLGEAMSINAVQRAIKIWDEDVIFNKYMNLFRSLK